MQIGRKIYFDKTTGNVIQDTGEMQGSVVETTIDQDFITFIELAKRNREAVGIIQLAYGQYAQDFAECNGYRINLETNTLEFSYPNPSEPTQEPVYQKPLSEEVKDLKLRQDTTENALLQIMGI